MQRFQLLPMAVFPLLICMEAPLPLQCHLLPPESACSPAEKRQAAAEISGRNDQLHKIREMYILMLFRIAKMERVRRSVEIR